MSHMLLWLPNTLVPEGNPTAAATTAPMRRRIVFFFFFFFAAAAAVGGRGDNGAATAGLLSFMPDTGAPIVVMHGP